MKSYQDLVEQMQHQGVESLTGDEAKHLLSTLGETNLIPEKPPYEWAKNDIKVSRTTDEQGELVIGWAWAFYLEKSTELYIGKIYDTREAALEEGAGGPAFLLKLVNDK